MMQFSGHCAVSQTHLNSVKRYGAEPAGRPAAEAAAEADAVAAVES